MKTQTSTNTETMGAADQAHRKITPRSSVLDPQPQLKTFTSMKNAIATRNSQNWGKPDIQESGFPHHAGKCMKQTLLVLLSFIVLSMPMATTAQVESLVASNTAFALNLYSELATNSGNLFFLPYSISTCLAMLYAGANGDTEQQMSQVLGFGTNQQQFASVFGDLQSELGAEQETNAIELNIANALWIQEGFPFLPAFLQTATSQYQANIGQADFISEASEVTDEINNWVAQETQNKIQNIVRLGLINAGTRFVLANALYFLGVWTTSFEETNTTTQPFYLSGTTFVEAPLMHQPFLVDGNGNPITFNYMDNWEWAWLGYIIPTNGFQALELPYGSNQLSMVILLPSQVDGLGQLEGQLTPSFLSNVLSQMVAQQVEIFLPRFTLESTFDLTNTLAAMGMPDAFTRGVADFSGIDGNTDLFVTFVRHKAWGQVNEAGTQAAAATVVGGGRGYSGGPPPPVFRADHPFLFLIRDTQTWSVLFLGRLTNPSPSATPATPALTVTPSASGLTVSWPASLTGLTLRQSSDLANWTASTGVSNDGTNKFITITGSQSRSLFFHLSSQ
jgi:serpin B